MTRVGFIGLGICVVADADEPEFLADIARSALAKLEQESDT